MSQLSTQALAMTRSVRESPEVTSIVFVVDDDVSVRESMELLIESAGWQPETFASAQEFLPVLADPPVLPRAGCEMPGLGGLELQQQLGERRDLPIIFVTGHAEVPTTVKAMKAGAVEFLTKPFDDSAMLVAIHGALERSRIALRHDSEIWRCTSATRRSRPANAR